MPPQSLLLLPQFSLVWWAGTACWLERRTRDRKVASSNPGRSGGRIFFSRVNFVCWLLFGVRSTPVLLQWHVKYPGYFAKSAGGRLHLNMHTPFTQRSRSGLTMPLSRHSVGTYQAVRSSHASLNCSGQKSYNNLQFMILTYLWPSNKVKFIKSGINC